MIKVLLAEDQALFRDSMKFMLEQDDAITVVGTAEDGCQAVKLCESLKPDIVLMDIEMPHMDGISATQVIRERFPKIKIIMLTTFEHPKQVMESFIADANGYLIKNMRHSDLSLAIRCAYSGITVIHPKAKAIMVERFRSLQDYTSQYKEILTEREIEIVRFIAKAFSNKEIGDILKLSEGTIKNNITKILHKLGMTDRLQIAIFAMENGIV